MESTASPEMYPFDPSAEGFTNQAPANNGGNVVRSGRSGALIPVATRKGVADYQVGSMRSRGGSSMRGRRSPNPATGGRNQCTVEKIT